MGLKVNDAVKRYGEKTVVDKISFEMKKPGVFGLLGTNGAGKTTTIRMILGILNKNEGEITWNDKIVTRENINFGYLPEERGIYPKTKIGEQLIYFAKLKGMNKVDAEKSLDYWLERLKVSEYKNMTAEKLSKGNQQKIQFITAIIHDPELIILDEPFSGLDPVNTELLRNVIIELVQKGKYIIMCSHQMVAIEEFCTEVVIMDKGKSVVQGNLKKIKEGYPANKLFLSTETDIKDLLKQDKTINIVYSKNNEYEINIKDEEEGYKIFDIVAKNNIKVIRFEIKKPSLHDIFVEKVGGR